MELNDIFQNAMYPETSKNNSKEKKAISRWKDGSNKYNNRHGTCQAHSARPVPSPVQR